MIRVPFDPLQILLHFIECSLSPLLQEMLRESLSRRRSTDLDVLTVKLMRLLAVRGLSGVLV